MSCMNVLNIRNMYVTVVYSTVRTARETHAVRARMRLSVTNAMTGSAVSMSSQDLCLYATTVNNLKNNGTFL